MRYKIEQKASGEVLVFQELNGRRASDAMAYLTGWERIAGPFVSWNDAEAYVNIQKKKQDLDRVVREQVFEV